MSGIGGNDELLLDGGDYADARVVSVVEQRQCIERKGVGCVVI